ncbi:MAG: response regulator transcription factor [Polynucleobacter sp.]|jgi:two-component system response regulator FimZ (fimbrial Z protein)/two-component system response regulator EvgA|nr:response regulator transcription factor [Polynucleobacter sp.]
MRKTVLLVDDHPAMLMALKSMLQNQLSFEVIGQAQNGEDCMQMVKQSLPSIVILDLDMPKTDGFDVIRRIGLSHPDIRILILSSLDEQVYGGRVRSLGAHGFVNKTAGANIILAACVAVSQGYTFFSVGKNGQGNLSDHEKMALISDRELQVMKYLGKGNSNQQISDRLHISSKTVATYKTRLFEKIGVNNIADLILFCRNNKIIEG